MVMNNLPELADTHSGLGRKGNGGMRTARVGVFPQAGTALGLGEGVPLGEDKDIRNGRLDEIGFHVKIKRRDGVSGIDQEKDELEWPAGAKIIGHHFLPPSP